MRNATRRHLWLPTALTVLVLLVAQGCAPSATTIGVEPDADARIVPSGPTLNHAKHMAKNMECGDCHDPDETGKIAVPAASLCFDCHDEDIANAPPKLKAYFESIRQADGTFALPKMSYAADLIFDHAPHTAAGTTCAECHGEPAETGFGRDSLMKLKASCLSCHEAKGASLECAACHREERKDRAPASHADGFLAAHGERAPAAWKDGKGGLCAQCHAVPQSCDECHGQTKPQSHNGLAFRMLHGQEIQDVPLADTSCSLCHDQKTCTLCHQTEKPRSHTTSFERRFHGIKASVERQSCATCHKPDFCDSCHQESRPISHTGSFGSGKQRHCITCHDPLPMNGCYACHKNTLGHRQATPMPPGWPHDRASTCDECHPIVPHLNDGGDCRRCHRILR
jgi:predicted CXXCH cytochrome family protein